MTEEINQDSWLADFSVDNKKRKDGVWKTAKLDKVESSFLIGNVSEADFLIELEKAQNKKLAEKSKQAEKLGHGKKKAAASLSNADHLQITIDLIVKLRLLDWKNVKDVNGDDVKYTKSMAVSMLKSSEGFKNWINQNSTDLSNFYVDRREEAVKK